MGVRSQRDHLIVALATKDALDYLVAISAAVAAVGTLAAVVVAQQRGPLSNDCGVRVKGEYSTSSQTSSGMHVKRCRAPA